MDKFKRAALKHLGICVYMLIDLIIFVGSYILMGETLLTYDYNEWDITDRYNLIYISSGMTFAIYGMFAVMMNKYEKLKEKLKYGSESN